MNQIHVMIDLETFGTSSNASVATIGAVKFSTGKDENFSNTFYCRVDRNSCRELGLDEDDKTIGWWKQQAHAAQIEVFDESLPRLNVADAFKLLANFCSGANFVWGNSCCFDLIICENIFSKLKIAIPWKFYQKRDVRTAKMFFKNENKRINDHNSLSDAINQAKDLVDVFHNCFSKV